MKTAREFIRAYFLHDDANAIALLEARDREVKAAALREAAAVANQSWYWGADGIDAAKWLTVLADQIERGEPALASQPKPVDPGPPGEER